MPPSKSCEKLFDDDIVNRTDLAQFCIDLYRNKVSKAISQFEAFSPVVQCLFLSEAWGVLSGPLKGVSSYSIRMSHSVFKLFTGKSTIKDSVVYAPYKKLKTLKKFMDRAKGSVGKGPAQVKKGPTQRGPKKVYGKKYQKRDEPDELDPLTLFYTSAYKQDGKQRMSIKWLTENGVLEGGERVALEKKYEEL